MLQIYKIEKKLSRYFARQMSLVREIDLHFLHKIASVVPNGSIIAFNWYYEDRTIFNFQ